MQLELAEANLRVAERLYAMARSPEERLDAVGKVLRAREDLKSSRAEFQRNKDIAACFIASVHAEYCASLVSEAVLFQVRQSAARFIAKEGSSDDGWKWPVRAMQSGWAQGSLESSAGVREATPHYFPPEIVGRVAEALDGARFRRKHPETGDGSEAPELTAGWISDTRAQDGAAFATVNLLHSSADIRSMLLAAQEARKLDLFGVSIFAYFAFKKSQVGGKPALVATDLHRFIALDLCAEPGAGGRFLASA